MRPEAEAGVGQIVESLYQLQAATVTNGEPQPVVLELTPEAKSTWKRFYNAHVTARRELTGELAAAWPKLAEYAARLALVLHCVRQAADDPGSQDAAQVDAASVEAAVELMDWFKHETRRVYTLLGVPGSDAPQHKLLEWILHKGGAVTVRDVQRGMRCYETAADAEAALNELVAAGKGVWQTTRGPSGPWTRQFSASCVDGLSLDPEEKRECVDVDTQRCYTNREVQ